MGASMTTEEKVPRYFTQEQLDGFLSVPGVRKVGEVSYSLLIPTGSDYDGPRSIEAVVVYVPFWYALLPKWFRRRFRIRFDERAPGGVPFQVKYKAWW